MNVFSTPPQPSTGQQRPPPPPPAGPQQLLSPSSPAVFLACDTRQFPVFVPSPSTHSSDMPDASELAAGAAKYPHFVLNFMVQMEYMFGKPHSPLPPLKGLPVHSPVPAPSLSRPFNTPLDTGLTSQAYWYLTLARRASFTTWRA